MRPELDFLLRVAVAVALGVAGFLIPEMIDRRNRGKAANAASRSETQPRATHA